jgi:hypothetical protein
VAPNFPRKPLVQLTRAMVKTPPMSCRFRSHSHQRCLRKVAADKKLNFKLALDLQSEDFSDVTSMIAFSAPHVHDPHKDSIQLALQKLLQI